ncbi:MAG: response regulator [Peptococcales bacterium]
MKREKCDILIVDDQLGVRSLLKTAFSEQGYSVETAANGEEGVEKVCEYCPKLILMDIKMPVKDGITALYEIKAQFPEVMVIMMTAYGEVETIQRIKKGGALDFFSKPFDLEVLLKYVDNLLQGEGAKLA